MMGMKHDGFSVTRILPSSFFVTAFLLFVYHNTISLCLRMSRETKYVTRINNISKDDCHRTVFIPTTLSTDYNIQQLIDCQNYLRFLKRTKQLNLKQPRQRTKRESKNIINNHEKTSVLGSSFPRVMLSRQQKMGPVFYHEPPSIFYFSNDTGN